MSWRRGGASTRQTARSSPASDAWSAEDPVDAWECERARLILKIQGNENKVVAEACKKAGL